MTKRMQPLYRYVVTVGRIAHDGRMVIGHTIVVNAFNCRDAQTQSRAYLRSLTYSFSKPRRVR